MERSKVVIVGTGFVGMSYAYALVNQGAVEEIVLIDIDPLKAEGEAMDLNHGLAFAPRKMSIKSGTYQDTKDAGLVVITAGVSQKDGETRLDLLARNAKIMKTIVKDIMASGFSGIILVATNPVDLLTYVVWKESGLPSHRVIGSGTSLDSARLRYEISRYIEIDVRNIHAYILGEHGDSEFVCWSNANVGGKPFKDVIESMHQITFDDLEDIAYKVKHAAYDIILRKKATYYGIGMALVRITSAIFNNENRILPISVYNEGIYPCESDIYIGLPAVLNRDGVHHIVKLNLSEKEKDQLNHSASLLRKNLDSILKMS
ncbi:MAG: L-lactate dehydrogenase [Tenericutes bacterium GWC2_34_14]|nr:MAG: L-lactate dehydrogenase [Tenericutes bacterium GWA2_35_7]OHE29933.1 MAG: L-lactate dehydrogenase [Tenericutes bacterium GWC2_34_14]OHE34912.1 MAG: L-lactate dehydrogenase [Tenericutes bacterium GWE2_34_108]OHE37228.1 MAG: L-lactate dehydrogenase [Tenericutes bacterium GWF1_35_14]OHE39640.1 MAG: L-lactate dehydrogenase [Tenericutes bacterium GWF2_35_184]OHE41559.1 MAG: L-lactate dehydrogenase [Tenericutes bacterium RIFOXYA12_FULL_35_10]OHE44172.1 MAG: L-lactate dehydrogenase [Tenericut